MNSVGTRNSLKRGMRQIKCDCVLCDYTGNGCVPMQTLPTQKHRSGWLSRMLLRVFPGIFLSFWHCKNVFCLHLWYLFILCFGKKHNGLRCHSCLNHKQFNLSDANLGKPYQLLIQKLYSLINVWPLAIINVNRLSDMNK